MKDNNFILYQQFPSWDRLRRIFISDLLQLQLYLYSVSELCTFSPSAIWLGMDFSSSLTVVSFLLLSPVYCFITSKIFFFANGISNISQSSFSSFFSSLFFSSPRSLLFEWICGLAAAHQTLLSFHFSFNFMLRESWDFRLQTHSNESSLMMLMHSSNEEIKMRFWWCFRSRLMWVEVDIAQWDSRRFAFDETLKKYFMIMIRRIKNNFRYIVAFALSPCDFFFNKFENISI